MTQNTGPRIGVHSDLTHLISRHAWGPTMRVPMDWVKRASEDRARHAYASVLANLGRVS